MELELPPAWVYGRIAQWGILAILIAGATTSSLDATGALGMLLIGWGAKGIADREEALVIAHYNMRHYIKRGGLHNPPRRINLAKMS